MTPIPGQNRNEDPMDSTMPEPGTVKCPWCDMMIDARYTACKEHRTPSGEPPACPPWCDVRVAHTAHSRDLDTFEGNGFTVAVELSQTGTRPATVRVFGFEDGVDYGEQYPHVVLPVIVAAQIGQFVTALGTPAAFDFAAALTRGLALIARGSGQ